MISTIKCFQTIIFTLRDPSFYTNLNCINKLSSFLIMMLICRFKNPLLKEQTTSHTKNEQQFSFILEKDQHSLTFPFS